jgi:hypothetical protein
MIDFDPSATPQYGNSANMETNCVKRLTNLCARRGTFRLLKKCILEGYSENIVNLVEQALVDTSILADEAAALFSRPAIFNNFS